MGRVKTIARRTFLIGAAAITGGVAFGAYKILTPHANPLEDGLAAGEATFNPWVKITAERITLIVPHADVGQGVASSQAALIAEEMDLDFGQFDIDFGTPSAAYWNRALANDALPLRTTDDGLLAQGMRGAGRAAFKLLGVQVTGGSSTIPDSFVKLREAGAIARETLKRAASARTGQAAETMTTASGAVVLSDGSRLAYTDLAEDAASVEPVTDVSLRDPSEWRLIGKPMPRLDTAAKATGTQTYGIDLSVPGMVHATVRMNPRIGGAVQGFDDTEARGMRGVSAIFEIPGGIAVVADNTWRAFRAAETVKVDWGSAPYPPEMEAHWQALSESFTEERQDSRFRDDGDMESALTGGDLIEAEYRSPYVAHAPLEPLSAIVLVQDEGVEVWAGHQVPGFLQQIVAGVTGHAPEQVAFHNQFSGGSFGHRLEFDFVRNAAEVANRMRGTPVKMTLRREEDMTTHDFPRHIAMGRARGRVQNGQVTALDLSIAAPSVSASQMGRMGLPAAGPDIQIVAGAWNAPYALPAFRVTGYRAPELVPVSSWRAVGAPGAGFMLETFLDELIAAAGADPLAERLRLVDNPIARGVLEAVGEMANWGAPLGANQGRGLAFVESFGVPTAVVLDVTATDAGIRMDRAFVACDVGTVNDPDNLENNVSGGVAFALGHAIDTEITYSNGIAEQSNFDLHTGLRLPQCPAISVRALENGDTVRGVGEPSVPPTAPALSNAIFAATGRRLREMPFRKAIDFA